MPSRLSYAFGGNTGVATQQELERRRALVDALMGARQAPRNLGEGLSFLGEAIGSRLQSGKLRREEESAKSSGSKLFNSLFGGKKAINGPLADTPASYGDDDTFNRMIDLESGGNPDAVSPKGATGIAQIMPATARDPGYGLEDIFDTARGQGVQVADNSDATLQGLLRNPDVNASFGRKYFDRMKTLHGGDERLAAAAYNAGPGAVEQAGGVPAFEETQNYVDALGLNGQPAPQQVAQAGPSLDELLAATNDPAFEHINPVLQKRITDEIERLSTPPDPMKELQLQKLQQEVAQGLRKKPLEVEGRLLDPDTFEVLYEAPAKPAEPYTLGEGQLRFGPDDKQVAAGVPKSPDTVFMGEGSVPDGELRKELQKNEAKNWGELQNVASVSAQTAQDLTIVDELVEMAPTGPVTGRLAEYFPGVSSSAAALDSIVKRLAPTLRVPGSGATSDIEYEGMLRGYPALRNYPEANRLISQIMKSKAGINVERGAIVDAYSSGQIDAPTARAKLNEINKRSILSPEMRRLLAGVNPDAGGNDIEERLKRYQ